MSTVINGKSIADNILLDIKSDIALVTATDKNENLSNLRPPQLTVIVVGTRRDSASYVSRKVKACATCGIESNVLSFPDDVTEFELTEVILKLNIATDVDGILVQLPLPPHINSKKIIEKLDRTKDVDGLHPHNLGMLAGRAPHRESSIEESILLSRTKENHLSMSLVDGLCQKYIGNEKDQVFFAPCTAIGVIELLLRSKVNLNGARAVVVGRSILVGIPVALLLQQCNATVTVCHSKTKDLQQQCAQADIIIAAIGNPKMIDRSFIKEGAVVIDVGINVDVETKKLCGDVNFEDVKDVCSLLTPVPGMPATTIGDRLYNHYVHLRWCWPNDCGDAHEKHNEVLDIPMRD